MSGYGKIFRPWASRLEGLAQHQDSTISTTSTDAVEEEEQPKQLGPKKGEKKRKEVAIKEESSEPHQALATPEMALSADNYAGIHPDVLQANLAHSLGLNPADPLFLESLVQGCAVEEYARILSQEHHAKLLGGRKQRPKKYRCPHCDVGFSNNGQLKGHIRIHTGERPFRCDEKNCGKTFTRNEELTRHKRIHSGLRPFPCSQCGKRFGRKDHLKKHSRTHMQTRGLYALPVMLPMEAWTHGMAASPYPYVPMFGF